jgi:ribonuclease HI
MSDTNKKLKITYKNYRDVVTDREITPINIWFGATQWHPKEQWLLKAYDHTKDDERDFALVDINQISIPVVAKIVQTSLPTETIPKHVKLYADGGSRGNPGPSAGGYVLLDMADTVVKSNGKYLGVTTNNQAEYHSLKGGLEMAKQLGVQEVDVYMDSLLVVNQMKGIFKIKNRDLWPIHDAIKKLLPAFHKVSFTHVPRELNKLADAEVNKTLDAVSGK